MKILKPSTMLTPSTKHIYERKVNQKGKHFLPRVQNFKTSEMYVTN